MFIAAIFTIVKVWKQPKFPSVDQENVRNTHTHTGMLFSLILKEILPFTPTSMNLEGITLSELSQTEKDKYGMVSYIDS